MRQVWIPRVGAPEVLEVRDAADREAGPDQVRIRVTGAGVNFADILARMGLYPDAPKPPVVVGYEVAGVVDDVGSDVTGFSTGDRVVALTRFGGYSDVVCVPAGQTCLVPEALTLEEAAALPVNYLTAWLMLVHLGNVRSGDTVLVHACAGGVGLAALQICRSRGAEVIGTASGAKHERLRSMGVAHCVDYHHQDFEAEVAELTGGRGVDVVLDAVGGRSFAKSYRSLAPLGRLFLFGVSSLAPGKRRSIVATVRGMLAMPSFKPLSLLNDNRGVFGFNLGHLWSSQELLLSALQEIVAGCADGTYEPVVDRSFAFDEAPAAHRYLQDHANFGKVLLVP